MKEFKNKVAVITGGANGLGLEIAKEAVRREMKVVIGDICQEFIDQATAILDQMSADYVTLKMDASLYEEMVKLSELALERYGQVDLFFNNAGVVVTGPVWELPVKDIDYIIASNLSSVAYGLKVFIPIMEAQGTDCHIVDTASAAGLLSAQVMPTYHMTKFGNVGLTESTYLKLQENNSKIKMSVYCPGYVQTDLHNCDSRRPERFAVDDDPYYQSPAYRQYAAINKHVIETGIPADSVGLSVFQAIEDEKFYILTHPAYMPLIGLRVKNILDGNSPDINFFKR